MSIYIITALVFMATLALTISALYFFVLTPVSNRAMRARLEAIQQANILPGVDRETELLREQLLSHLPYLNRVLYSIPPFARFNLFLQQAGMQTTVAFIITLSISLACVALLTAFLLRVQVLLCLVISLITGAVPFIVVAARRRKRLSLFEAQFPDAIDLLARAVRAGHAFTTGLELIASEMSEPVAIEFRRTYEQQNLGLPLREALQNLVVRIPLSDVHIFVTALIIQRETGGNLAEILDNLSRVIRDRFKLLQQIKAFTAQGRLSLMILISISPVMALILYLLNREYIYLLFSDPLGQKMVAVAVFMQLVGFVTIRNIIQPKP
jgi:tight adherence protein B